MKKEENNDRNDLKVPLKVRTNNYPSYAQC